MKITSRIQRMYQRSDQDEFIRRGGDCFVSIYLPTDPTGVGSKQNSLRYRWLLSSAKDQLRGHGLSESDCQRFLAQAQEITTNATFWNHVSLGMSVLISEGDTDIRCLPTAFPKICVVGTSYYLLPLLTWLKSNKEYYLIAVSLNSVRLMHGSSGGVQEITIPELDWQYLESNSHNSGITHTSTDRGNGNHDIHKISGTSFRKDDFKAEIQKYFRRIDEALKKTLCDQTKPLLFCGVDEHFPLYREVNHYPHLIENQHVSGCPDRLSCEVLHGKSWELIERIYAERYVAEVENYWNLAARARVTNQIQEVIAAANAGIVENLFINSCSLQNPAYLNQSNGEPDYDEANTAILINQCALLTLRHHGNLIISKNGDLPGGGSIAATLRYRLPAETLAAMGNQ